MSDLVIDQITTHYGRVEIVISVVSIGFHIVLLMINRKYELPNKIIVHIAFRGFIGIRALVFLFRYLSRRDLYNNVTHVFCT